MFCSCNNFPTAFFFLFFFWVLQQLVYTVHDKAIAFPVAQKKREKTAEKTITMKREEKS
jgi:hypothetical protein